MPLSQQQPIIPGMLDQPTDGLPQPLPRTRQRPTLDPVRQLKPPPEVTESVVGQHRKLQEQVEAIKRWYRNDWIVLDNKLRSP